MPIEVDLLEAAGHRIVNGVDNAVAIDQRAQQVNGFGFAAKRMNSRISEEKIRLLETITYRWVHTK